MEMGSSLKKRFSPPEIELINRLLMIYRITDSESYANDSNIYNFKMDYVTKIELSPFDGQCSLMLYRNHITRSDCRNMALCLGNYLDAKYYLYLIRMTLDSESCSPTIIDKEHHYNEWLIHNLDYTIDKLDDWIYQNI